MNPEESQESVPEETVAIQIILTKDGGIKILGPCLADRTASYGLLEVAKDMVREMHTPKIVKPSGILNGLRTRGH